MRGRETQKLPACCVGRCKPTALRSMRTDSSTRIPARRTHRTPPQPAAAAARTGWAAPRTAGRTAQPCPSPSQGPAAARRSRPSSGRPGSRLRARVVSGNRSEEGGGGCTSGGRARARAPMGAIGRGGPPMGIMPPIIIGCCCGCIIPYGGGAPGCCCCGNAPNGLPIIGCCGGGACCCIGAAYRLSSRPCAAAARARAHTRGAPVPPQAAARAPY